MDIKRKERLLVSSHLYITVHDQTCLPSLVSLSIVCGRCRRDWGNVHLIQYNGAANAWRCFLIFIHARRSPQTLYHLRSRGSPCARNKEPLRAIRMEMNNDLGHGSSEVLPPGFSSDAQPHQVEHNQDSIDPTFRLSAATDQSPSQQHLQQTSHDTPATTIHQQSPGRQPAEKAKKKGSGQGPRLRKACDGCSRRKVKVCSFLSSSQAMIDQLLRLSVTNSNLARPASHCTFHACSPDQADGEVLGTVQQTPSESR